MAHSGLQKAIREFAAEHPDYETAEEKTDSYTRALAFKLFLVKTGIQLKTLELVDARELGVEHLYGIEPDDHWVVLAGGTYVDWTARKFDPDLPVPLTWKA